MKKFYVVHTRENLFRGKKNPKEFSTFTQTFDHAVDAWARLKLLREHNERDPRWPVLTVKVEYK